MLHMMLMRQKCLLSDNNIFCRLGYRLSNNIYLIWMVFNSISTCLLFSVKLFNTDVPTMDNSLGLQDDMRFLVSTTRPRGHACKSTCKSVQLYATSLFIFVIHFFFVSPENASANFSLVGTTRLCALDRILRLMAAGFGYEVVAV